MEFWFWALHGHSLMLNCTKQQLKKLTVEFRVLTWGLRLNFLPIPWCLHIVMPTQVPKYNFSVAVTSFPGHGWNSLVTSASSNCIQHHGTTIERFAIAMEWTWLQCGNALCNWVLPLSCDKTWLVMPNFPAVGVTENVSKCAYVAWLFLRRPGNLPFPHECN